MCYYIELLFSLLNSNDKLSFHYIVFNFYYILIMIKNEVYDDTKDHLVSEFNPQQVSMTPNEEHFSFIHIDEDDIDNKSAHSEPQQIKREQNTKPFSKFLHSLPFIISMMFILSLYTLYLNFTVIALINNSKNEISIRNISKIDKYSIKGGIYFIIFNVLFTMTLFCLFRLVMTSPGYVDDKEYISIFNWDNVINNKFGNFKGVALDEQFEQNDISRMFKKNCDVKLINKKISLIKILSFLLAEKLHPKKICKKCKIIKPEKAHHCKICKRCVRQFNHHCFLLYTCIGLYNYKFYLLCVIYSLSLLSFMLSTSIETFITLYSKQFYSLHTKIYIGFLITLIIFTVFIMNLCIIHISNFFCNTKHWYSTWECFGDEANWLSYVLPTTPKFNYEGYFRIEKQN